MAIALDNSAKFTDTGTTTVGGSFTTSGSNRVLVAYTFDAIASANTTGVTYGGVSMTLVHQGDVGGSDGTETMWVLPNPASGSNTITASRTTGTGSFTVFALSLTGANQTAGTGCLDTNSINSQKYAANGVGGSSTSVTTTFGVSTNNSYLVGGAWSGKGSLGASTGATVRAGGVQTSVQGQDSSTSGNAGIFDSNGAQGVGNYGMTVTFTGGRGNLAVVAVKEFTAVGPTNIASINGAAAASISSLNGTSYAAIDIVNGVT